MSGTEFTIDHANLEFANRPIDAQTIYIDGIKGIMLSPEAAKISFFETVTDPLSNSVRGRFVANLAMTPAQFRAVAEHLSQTSADFDARLASQSAQAVEGDESGEVGSE